MVRGAFTTICVWLLMNVSKLPLLLYMLTLTANANDAATSVEVRREEVGPPAQADVLLYLGEFDPELDPIEISEIPELETQQTDATIESKGR